MTKITATTAAVGAVLSALVLLGVINLSVEALAAINVGVGAVLVAIGAWFDSSIPFGANQPSDGE